MSERRQATRRESITVEVRGKDFLAEPLDWRSAGDLGNEIIRQNLVAVNESVRMYVEGDMPQLDMRLAQKISDWDSVMKVAYPKNKLEEFVEFDIDEMATLVLTSLEVNHLEHLNHLVDPNSPTPMLPGGTSTSGIPIELGQKTESSPDSSSLDSPTEPSQS